MLSCFSIEKRPDVIQLIPITKDKYPTWLAQQSQHTQSWLKANAFVAEYLSFIKIPSSSGSLAQVVICVDGPASFWAFGSLSCALPPGHYVLADTENIFAEAKQKQKIYLAWGLGSYQFNRYRSQKKSKMLTLHIPDEFINSDVSHWVENIHWIRDLINTPAQDMNTVELLNQGSNLLKKYNAEIVVYEGEKLEREFPAVAAVGRGSRDPSYLLEAHWGSPQHPKVALVGKGVCFDTGGLDLKTSEGMRIMKKDMGGAANALGLAKMIMQQQLPIRLHVLIPIVENAISGGSYHPGDILQTRKGITVEVHNTDAEGRLIMCDALTRACEMKPDYLFDFATLTGANRIALGGHIASLFSSDERVAEQLLTIANQEDDPVWRMPLYRPYLEWLRSEVADIANATVTGYGGSITAALFLQKFVEKDVPWVHFDMSAWNFSDRPGRPCGGEAMAIRTVYNFIKYGIKG